VHTGAVRVVGAHPAVPVTVQGGRVTAIPAVALACDEIDERFFLDLLHGSLTCVVKRAWADALWGMGDRCRAVSGLGVPPVVAGFEPRIGRGRPRAKGEFRFPRPTFGPAPAGGVSFALGCPECQR